MALERFDIDPGHTVVGFSVRHLVIAKVRGVFTRVSGWVELDETDMGRSRAEVRIQAASIVTNETERDDHLRSADFLDTARYPEITYRSTGVETLDATHFRLIGDLTLHGVTRKAVLDVTYGGRARDPYGGERVGFEARTSFDRTDFGLNWNAALEAGGVLVGDAVDISIEVEAVKSVSAETAAPAGTSYDI